MSLSQMPKKLINTISDFFDSIGCQITNFVVMPESPAYNACSFEISNKRIIFRSAKITPTKTGQFVTVWKRNKNGITQPYEQSDDFDFIIIQTVAAENSGYFIFSKTVLLQRGIVSSETKPGKRGIRVYPPWDTTSNKQAWQTQKWQLDYFLQTTPPIDFGKAKKLLQL